MLATLAALQLVVLSQVAPPPREITPGDAAAEEGTRPARAGESPAGPAGNPPLPERHDRAAPAAPARPRQLSLLSAEPLRGGSAALAWAGWSSLGIMYGQGVTDVDDLVDLAHVDGVEEDKLAEAVFGEDFFPELDGRFEACGYWKRIRGGECPLGHCLVRH